MKQKFHHKRWLAVVRIRMEWHDLNQRELAILAGLSQAGIGHALSGNHIPTIATVVLISNALDIALPPFFKE